MYGLVEFRMNSLDRRVPIAGAALTATLASVSALPDETLMVVFIGLPMALIWFLRTTINHARSFEDVLRRIEHLEKEINALVGVEVVAFQSRHPSRGIEVGGRTGSETIGAVLVTVVTLLIGCGVMFLYMHETACWPALGYVGGITGALAYVVLLAMRLRRYEYKSD